jgi:predicted acylesterase/phospholipase RssA
MRGKTLKLRLYTTVHGGLKTAVLPKTKFVPKLGLALAGGGAKAAASIGVLKVLEQEGIPVAAVAGTSMGAGVGGLFAAGHHADEIAWIVLGNDWNDIFTDTPRRAFMTQEQRRPAAAICSISPLPRRSYRRRTFRGPEADNLLASKTLAYRWSDLDSTNSRSPSGDRHGRQCGAP